MTHKALYGQAPEYISELPAVHKDLKSAGLGQLVVPLSGLI